MRKLRIGDRVRVYGADEEGHDKTGNTGTVVGLRFANFVLIRLNKYPDCLFHENQCRKLKPRKPAPTLIDLQKLKKMPATWWIKIGLNLAKVSQQMPDDPTGWICVEEVDRPF